MRYNDIEIGRWYNYLWNDYTTSVVIQFYIKFIRIDDYYVDYHIIDCDTNDVFLNRKKSIDDFGYRFLDNMDIDTRKQKLLDLRLVQ